MYKNLLKITFLLGLLAVSSQSAMADAGECPQGQVWITYAPELHHEPAGVCTPMATPNE